MTRLFEIESLKGFLCNRHWYILNLNIVLLCKHSYIKRMFSFFHIINCFLILSTLTTSTIFSNFYFYQDPVLWIFNPCAWVNLNNFLGLLLFFRTFIVQYFPFSVSSFSVIDRSRVERQAGQEHGVHLQGPHHHHRRRKNDNDDDVKVEVDREKEEERKKESFDLKVKTLEREKEKEKKNTIERPKPPNVVNLLAVIWLFSSKKKY